MRTDLVWKTSVTICWAVLALHECSVQLFAQAIPNSQDYYVAWRGHLNKNWPSTYCQTDPVPYTWDGKIISNPICMPPKDSLWDLAQRISYESCRYFVSGMLRASEVRAIPTVQRDSALAISFRVLQQIFDTSSYYRDLGNNMPPTQSNGLNDGFRGWYGAKMTTSLAIKNLSAI